MNYPTGVPDKFDYCVLNREHERVWESIAIEGSWFPTTLIGTMASMMRFAEGSADYPAVSV